MAKEDRSQLDKIETLMEVTHQDVKDIKKCVFGNGNVGLKLKVDRLEQENVISEKLRAKQSAWMIAAFAVLFGGLVTTTLKMFFP